jgi:hypothetical protein
MVVLDFFIVNVALPSIQSNLHASAGSIELVTAGYALTSAVFLISGARLGDRLGRRRVFAAGLALFTLASAACGTVSDPTLLVAARLVQGVAGAMLMPNVLSIIGVAYAGADRVKALSMYGMSMGLAAVSGQLIGGLLVQWNPAGLGWRSCFLINVPIGVLGLALAPKLVPESREAHARRVDWLGTVLVTTGLTAIVFPLVEGRQHGWPLWTWLSLAAAPGRLRRPAAATDEERRGAVARHEPVQAAGVQRRADRTGGVLVRTGVVLPRARAVPAGGPRTERAPRRAGVHHPGGVLPGGVDAGGRARGQVRPPGPDRRSARTGHGPCRDAG